MNYQSQTLTIEVLISLEWFTVQFETGSIERNRLMTVRYNGFLLDTAELPHTHPTYYKEIKKEMCKAAEAYWNSLNEASEKPANKGITGIPTLDYQPKESMATKAIDVLIKSSMCIILFFLFPSFSFSQMHVDFGVGMSRLNKALPTATDENGKVLASRNIFYNLNISADYQIANVVLGGDFIPQFGGSVANTPSYAGLKAGYAIANFTPAIGYYRAWVSSDNPELNKYVPGYSLTYYHEMGEPGSVYAKMIYINNSVIANIGCRINIE